MNRYIFLIGIAVILISCNHVQKPVQKPVLFNPVKGRSLKESGKAGWLRCTNTGRVCVLDTNMSAIYWYYD